MLRRQKQKGGQVFTHRKTCSNSCFNASFNATSVRSRTISSPSTLFDVATGDRGLSTLFLTFLGGVV
jgi:hypothetical protein